jgi:dimethylargininase
VPASLARCELTHLARAPIDPVRAAAQHVLYESALAACGWTVRHLPSLDDHPDAVFVEDAAVVVDEIAVVARPGAESRRGEVPTVEAALRTLRPIERIVAPGTLDGGDVLRVGRRIRVGRSARSNDEGARQLRAILEPLGYDVRPMPFSGCLHLKTAVTAVADDLVLVNPAWVDETLLAPLRTIAVHPDEPFAANVLRLGDSVLAPADAPRTAERLRAAGIRVAPLDMSELAKAEGGLTCCSILVD